MGRVSDAAPLTRAQLPTALTARSSSYSAGPTPRSSTSSCADWTPTRTARSHRASDHRSGSGCHTHGQSLLLPHTVYLPRSTGKITVKDLHLLVSEIELRDHAKKDDDDDDDDDDDAEAPPKAKAKRAAQ